MPPKAPASRPSPALAANATLVPLDTTIKSTALATLGAKASTAGKGEVFPERAKARKAFLEKHCKEHVSEEWSKVDDEKLAKLRGILAALREENQPSQILKKASENAQATQSLEATRSSVGLRLDACKQREAQFKKKQEELKQHVQDNEKALQELHSNIEKSEKKVKDEQAECLSLDVDIRALETELSEQQAGRELELSRIERMAAHKKFLEAVVQDGEEEFEGDVEVLINRHKTLQAGNQELHQTNGDLTHRLDTLREECVRVQTKLQNDHLMMSSQLNDRQLTLDRHRTETQELESKLNKVLEEKELKESQVGVIQMAIEQLFSRTVTSCRLPQRKKAMLDAVDFKYAPVLRGDKSDARLEEMLEQIVERMKDLRDMHRKAMEYIAARGVNEVEREEDDEVDVADRVKFIYEKDGSDKHTPSAQATSQSGGVASTAQSSGTSVSVAHKT